MSASGCSAQPHHWLHCAVALCGRTLVGLGSCTQKYPELSPLAHLQHRNALVAGKTVRGRASILAAAGLCPGAEACSPAWLGVDEAGPTAFGAEWELSGIWGLDAVGVGRCCGSSSLAPISSCHGDAIRQEAFGGDAKAVSKYTFSSCDGLSHSCPMSPLHPFLAAVAIMDNSGYTTLWPGGQDTLKPGLPRGRSLLSSALRASMPC